MKKLGMLMLCIFPLIRIPALSVNCQRQSRDLESSQEMKILFYIDHITVRGTTSALFAYAYHNEKLLGNTSQIIMDYTNLSRCESIALQYYPKVMPITIYSSEETLQR